MAVCATVLSEQHLCATSDKQQRRFTHTHTINTEFDFESLQPSATINT